LNFDDVIPLDCPVCLLCIRDADDANSYRLFSCCADCRMQWAEPNSDKWSSGWRPSAEQLNYYRHKLSQRPTYLMSSNFRS
jgi:hypothetical protein